jgi:hypothetical protein
MKRSIVILATLLACLVPHCKKDSNNPTNNPIIGTIMPLKVGNSWTFRVNFNDTNGVPISTSDVTLSITRDTTMGNEKWHSLGSSWATNRSDGLWSLNNAGNAYLVLKYPAKVNDTYNSDGEQIVVTSINQAVTVAQGQFSCYVYRSLASGSSEYVQYCAPNVGWVKFEGYSRTMSGRSYVAVAYELKGLVLN